MDYVKKATAPQWNSVVHLFSPICFVNVKKKRKKKLMQKTKNVFNFTKFSFLSASLV